MPLMALRFVVLAALALVASASTQDAQGRCSARADDAEIFANFGTRAPYEASGADMSATPVHLEGCRPVQIWHFGRHGTRHGSGADIDLILTLPKLKQKIQQQLDAGRTVKLCAEDLQNILAWSPGIDGSKAYQLTYQGQQDLLHLGKRIRARFPELFENQNEANFEFRYDSTDRCKESSQYLFNGIFGDFPKRDFGKVDSLPDFYNRCPAYLAPLAKDFIMGSFNKFKKQSEYSDMIARVSSRLGFVRNLDGDDIDAMYAACSFERARNWADTKASPWCAVFQPEDFKVLEYWYDMKEYYRTGYGHKVHAKLGCVPVKEMVRALSERVRRDDESVSGVFYSSHDTLINQVIAFLGLYRDGAELRENNFAAMEGRQWRVTNFSPFASNLNAVLHQCSSGERYRVQLFLNEHLLPLERWGCGADACTWTQFTAKFGGVLNNCKQRRLCWGF